MKCSKFNLTIVPKLPGVYLFRKKQDYIYIGKAKNLKNRLGQYFKADLASLALKTQHMLANADDLEIITTENESAALLLENDLIKQYQPKYNILLKDDKAYPYIKLSVADPYPGIYFHRGNTDKKSHYFGPYTNKKAVKSALDKIQAAFKVRTCSNSYFSNRTRPCLLYQINRCSAPCVGFISKKAYQEQCNNIKNFFHNDSDAVISVITSKMQSHSMRQEYESAAKYRDQILALREIQRQSTNKATDDCFDVFYLNFLLDNVECYTLNIRYGKIVKGKKYFFNDIVYNDKYELCSNLLLQFYNDNTIEEINTIIINIRPANIDIIRKTLSKNKSKLADIIYRPQGDKARWLAMAKENCEHDLAMQRRAIITPDIMLKCGLDETPNYIECFDISHTSGVHTYGSCVVFRDGLPQRKEHRSYKLNPVHAADDYQALQLAVVKRYTDFVKHNKEMPDLIIIDGGKGQLNSVKYALEQLQLKNFVAIISISKGPARKEGLEQIHFSNGDIIEINNEVTKYKYILQIRNEAHNQARRSHTRKRDKQSISSFLESINGIGVAKKKILTENFLTLDAIKSAKLSDLTAIKGINIKIAKALLDSLNN